MPAPRKRPTQGQYDTLSRSSNTPVWVAIGWRILSVVALISIAIAVHWFDKEGLRDTYDGQISFLDVVYFTMISITTTGYGDIAPVTEQARMFDALVVTPIRIFVVLIFIGSAYNFVFKRTWDNWRMRNIQKRLDGHVVVAGFGTSGSEAVKELIARGTPATDIVVIDSDEDRLAVAEAMGCNVISADATRDETLNNVRIQTARAAVVSAGRDDTSILIVLTIRHLAEKLPISVVVRSSDNELLARQAGATNVINPVNFAGLLLAGSAHGEHIAEYMADLASVTGRVKLIEREVTDDEVGKSVSDLRRKLVARVYRNGVPYGFWEQECHALHPGDLLVEIVPGEDFE